MRIDIEGRRNSAPLKLRLQDRNDEDNHTTTTKPPPTTPNRQTTTQTTTRTQEQVSKQAPMSKIKDSPNPKPLAVACDVSPSPKLLATHCFVSVRCVSKMIRRVAVVVACVVAVDGNPKRRASAPLLSTIIHYCRLLFIITSWSGSRGQVRQEIEQKPTSKL